MARKVDWRLELALIVAHETGHRIRAIRHLRWSDVDLSKDLIRWRGEVDKIGRKHLTPLTEGAMEVLRQAQKERAAIGEAWALLPSPSDESEPLSRHLMRDWWYKAEELAGLEHIDGLGWHGLRRTFADGLRGVSLKDLADLVCWATPRTILEVYQGSDLDAMREAQERRRTLGDGVASEK